MKDYVRNNISPEMMEKFRKEYPNLTDEQIVEAITETFNKVGGIVISLVTQMWDVLKEATKDLTVEDLKQFMEDKKKKEDQDDIPTLEEYRYVSVEGLSFHEAEVWKSKLNCINHVIDYKCEGVSRDTFGDMKYVIKVYATKDISKQLKEIGKFYSARKMKDADDYADRIMNEVNKKERNIHGGL